MQDEPLTRDRSNAAGSLLLTPHLGRIRYVRFLPKTHLGSGLVDQSQKMTVAARAMAERKTVGHRS